MKDFNYSVFAKHYDVLEKQDSVENFNKVLDGILKEYNVKTVYDITCGTGVQAIYLHKKGYQVTASDFNKSMIEVARKKYSKINFFQEDMRLARRGEFDAVISIFNAIGHLSKKDFEKTLKNISHNLKQKGLYIFDIFNLEFMKKGFVTHEFIDVSKEVNGTRYVRFNKNKLDSKEGIMSISQRVLIQEGFGEIEEFKEDCDLQIYSSAELEVLLEKNGFEVLKFLDISGNKFDKEKSVFVLTIARKK